MKIIADFCTGCTDSDNSKNVGLFLEALGLPCTALETLEVSIFQQHCQKFSLNSSAFSYTNLLIVLRPEVLSVFAACCLAWWAVLWTHGEAGTVWTSGLQAADPVTRCRTCWGTGRGHGGGDAAGPALLRPGPLSLPHPEPAFGSISSLAPQRVGRAGTLTPSPTMDLSGLPAPLACASSKGGWGRDPLASAGLEPARGHRCRHQRPSLDGHTFLPAAERLFIQLCLPPKRAWVLT